MTHYVVDQIAYCTECEERWECCNDDNKKLAFAHRRKTGHSVCIQTETEYEGPKR